MMTSNTMKTLALTDPEIAACIEAEKERIENTIDLIASENYASSMVMQATGSVMTNKYAEGYPGKRYYGGCCHVDSVEKLAQERLLRLFSLDPALYRANVQPHAGAQANMAALFALLQPGDTLLGMNLAAGGHLTHGYPLNFSGIFYKTVQYGVGTDGFIDYDEMRSLALQHKPRLLIAGASAYSRVIDFKKCKTIADEVGAYFMVDMAHIAGLVAAGCHPSPFEYADVVTSTTHKTLRGPRGGFIICKSAWAKQVDKAIMPGIQGGPLMHQIAAKAVAFKEALEPEFTLYQKQVVQNAATMAHCFLKKGYTVVSGGTDTHLFVLDVRSKFCTGKEVELLLERCGIAVNKNCIPNDPASPLITSGIRIGSPSITSRGMKEKEAALLVEYMDDCIVNKNDGKKIDQIGKQIQILCRQFPVYK